MCSLTPPTLSWGTADLPSAHSVASLCEEAVDEENVDNEMEIIESVDGVQENEQQPSPPPPLPPPPPIPSVHTLKVHYEVPFEN